MQGLRAVHTAKANRSRNLEVCALRVHCGGGSTGAPGWVVSQRLIHPSCLLCWLAEAAGAGRGAQVGKVGTGDLHGVSSRAVAQEHLLDLACRSQRDQRDLPTCMYAHVRGLAPFV